jgi:hypothetical protein
MSSRPDDPRRIADLLIQHQEVAGGCACGWVRDSNTGSIWQHHAADVIGSHRSSDAGAVRQLLIERDRALQLLAIAQRREMDNKSTLDRLQDRIDELSATPVPDDDQGGADGAH